MPTAPHQSRAAYDSGRRRVKREGLGRRVAVRHGHTASAPTCGPSLKNTDRTAEVLLLDEEIGLLECGMRAGYSVLSQRIGRVHNGTLSRATFLMNGVSRHTGSFRIPGVTTRGEM